MSNTKTPQKNHRVPLYLRPHFLIILGLVLTALVIVAVMLRFQHHPEIIPEPSPSNQPSGQAVSNPDDSDKTLPEPTETDPGQTPTQYEGADPNALTGLTGSITLKSYDGTVLTVAAVIDQYLATNGTCTLNLKQGGRTLLSETLAAAPDVTASGCGPFRLTVPNLSGTYQLELLLSGDNRGGTITDEITI